ncbi:hypothetical protein [Desulfocurvus sp. DL9XJH121]
MSECLSLLDQALDLGERELEFLDAGDVDSLDTTVKERRRLIEEADRLRGEESVDVDLLVEKLHKLRSMQSALTTKARSLHETLTDDLSRIRREGRRLAGYGKASKITPLFGRRFMSKKG